jgi:hypothetical protein
MVKPNKDSQDDFRLAFGKKAYLRERKGHYADYNI